MRKPSFRYWLPFTFLSLLALVVFPACQRVSAQDVQGLLQAVSGKEAVVTLSDGTKMHVTIKDARAKAEAERMVGERVSARVRGRGDRQELVEVHRSATLEDQHASGAIQSITKDTVVIGGQTFKIDAATALDGGLMQGVTARVEFVKMADGTMVATEVETDADDDHIAGAIESINGSQVVIDGKIIHITGVTRLDDGLAKGVQARVEFATQPDGTLVAIEVETDRDDVHVAGVIESIGQGQVKIGGQTFVVNAATALDSGLATGVLARVEFVKMADGTMVATEVETDARAEKARGEIESISGNTVVIGGQKFTVNGGTRMDDGLKVGEKVEVRFVTSSTGERIAERVRGGRGEAEARGREAEGEGARGREAEARGREAEGEGARGREAEARGRAAEGEGARGGGEAGDDKGGASGWGGGSSGSGSGK